MRIKLTNCPYKSKWKRDRIRGIVDLSCFEFALFDHVDEVEIIFNRCQKVQSNGYYYGFNEAYNKSNKKVIIRIHDDDYKVWLTWKISHELYHVNQILDKEIQIGSKEMFLTYKGKRYGRTKYKTEKFFEAYDRLDKYPLKYIARHLPWEASACRVSNDFNDKYGRI